MNKTELQEAIYKLDTKIFVREKDWRVVKQAAKAYRDLPEKIEGMKNPYQDGFADRYIAYNQALRDILNLLENQNDRG